MYYVMIKKILTGLIKHGEIGTLEDSKATSQKVNHQYMACQMMSSTVNMEKQVLIGSYPQKAW